MLRTKHSNPQKPSDVVEPNYFSNWGDIWYPKIANWLLPSASAIKWLTPNQVTLTSFVMYVIAAVALVAGGSWTIAAVILFPLSYILDCLDGQLARWTGRTSPIGDYLDKTLDVIKIGVINAAMGVAAVNLTGQSFYYLLAFASCFGFLFRYYIKLETVLGASGKDDAYLSKSSVRRWALYEHFEAVKNKPNKTIREHAQWQWDRHHAILALDEAEHVTFGALAALAGRPDLWLWAFAIGQLIGAAVRLVERGQQILHNPSSLTYPLRK